MSVRNGSQVMPEGMKHFPVSASKLSDVMDPKSNKASFEAVGGSVEAVAKALKTDLVNGISGEETDLKNRMEHFGGNFFAEQKFPSFLELIWNGLHDTTIIMLVVCAFIGLILNMTVAEEHAGVPGWVEPVAILVTVSIVLLVSASIDKQKEMLFSSLNKQLEKTNKRQVIRNGVMVEVTDREIVVGDLVVFNNVLQSNIPADGLFVSGAGVKMDQGALTGEPEPVAKGIEYEGESSNPLMFSGTEVKSGSGRMVVVAVGGLSFSGKIRAQVYEDGAEEEPSPLFKKLDKLAMDIGKMGLVVAAVCLICMCVIGFGVKGLRFQDEALDYLVTAITILVVAVPEGLPLAVTLSLAFSSFQMSNENNLVKHLDACETMGSATTICSDKTGTLTQNRMTVKGCWTPAAGLVRCATAASKLGDAVQAAYAKPAAGGAAAAKSDESAAVGVPVEGEGSSSGASLPANKQALDPLGLGICINSMDESSFAIDAATGETKFMGQPTECALLKFAYDLGYDFNKVRANTAGRSGATVAAEGRKFDYSSARKMMSWAVKNGDQGYRVYSKGGGEVILPRCTHALGASSGNRNDDNTTALTSEARQEAEDVISTFASEAMRTIALAYRDVPLDVDWAALDAEQKQPDGSPALAAECGLTLIGVVGIEDPLRDEVPPAIERCYTAGIDVRMVTGDNLETAVAIASRCGILKPEHFFGDFNDPKTRKLKPFRAMTGETFRDYVSVKKMVLDPETGVESEERVIVQQEFDKVWPYLRVMARCDPSDKKVLADGLNKSLICEDSVECERLRREEGIIIFPDRQVVAMTGDGTNDAPALKRADVGFAMGISGTPTAKDAADIILLDDNFASIVTAAKWGRNVYDSIQKFLQFQLTVNMSALTLATIGSLYVQKSPLSATQLLWLNLLMDSLASLALATEPPNEAQLKRPPVNRTSSIITPRMWYNMLGQAAYQVVVVLVLMFQGQHLAMDELDDAGVEDGVEFLEVTHTYSRQYTIIFNTYVLMQLFNEVNCRKLLGEKWVFSGMTENKYFVRIWASTIVLQVIFAQFGGAVVGCSGRGLNGVQWLFCIAVGCGSIPWQFFVSTIADYALASPGHSAGRFGAARHSLVEQQSAMRRRSSMSQGPKSPGSGSVRSVRGAKLV